MRGRHRPGHRTWHRALHGLVVVVVDTHDAALRVGVEGLHHVLERLLLVVQHGVLRRHRGHEQRVALVALVDLVERQHE
eukprot:6268022-Alexandrium_andersonii.AAC.1